MEETLKKQPNKLAFGVSGTESPSVDLQFYGIGNEKYLVFTNLETVYWLKINIK